jgi:serine/threonine protein kinase/Flp pilus assembly protein TadD
MSMRESVARYRIVSTLGRGSMGLVYLAEDPLLNRRVAIKMVDVAEDGGNWEDSRELLLRDAKAVANLSHPNIVTVHDVVEEGSSAFIVMEYIEGDTLAAHLKKTPLPDPSFTVQVLRQMGAGLDYAHSKGVIHRDIKPGNVMLGSGGVAKIVDFGIARVSNMQTSTPAGFIVGTAAYMSPEQFMGSALDGRADQYSLAAVGYEMMTGSTLFGDQPLPVMAYKAVNEMPPPGSSRNASLPSLVDAALTKALAKSPAARYRTCTEFVEELDRAIAGRTLKMPPADDRPTMTLKHPSAALALAPPKSSKAPWLAAALGALVLGGGLALWRMRPAETVAVNTTAATTPTVAEPKTEPAVKAEIPAPKSVPVTPPAVKAEPPKEPAAISKPPVLVKEEKQPEAANGKARPEIAEAFARGQEQLKARDFQAAIQSFTTVIAAQPKRALAFYYRGQAHQLAQENEAAIADYTQAIRFKPEDAFTYVERGICYVRLKKDDEAFADFNKALDLRMDLPAAFNGRGGILLRRKEYEGAIRDYTAALNLNPHNASAYRNRAAAKQAMGDKAGARADRKAAETAKQEN